MSDDLLANIEQLQNIEKQLFADLENPGLSADEQNKIIVKINNISGMRVDLYKEIGGMNQFYKVSLDNSEDTLNEQKIAIGIIEKELNDAKRRKEELKNAQINKLRMIELNSYYSDAYEEKTEFMKVIFYTLFPIVILSYFFKQGLLPNAIYTGLVIIIVFIGSYFAITHLSSIYMRDNMNYQTYDWFFNKENAPKPPANDGSETPNPWATSGSFGTCIGDSCCPVEHGLVFDYTSNTCITKPADNPSQVSS
jgi:hypothetical protein